MRLLLGGALLMAALALGSCAVPTIPDLAAAAVGSKPVEAFYDECAAQTASFVAMVECGKQRRNAKCSSLYNCSAEGNAFVQYADALAMSVANHELTEAQARQKLVEFRMSLINNANRNAAIVAAGAASAPTGPTTCFRNGNTVSCY